MVTFGSISLFTDLGERAPGAAPEFAKYIKDWDAPIQAAYADAGALGERALSSKAKRRRFCLSASTR